MKYDIFISYRRKTGADDARLLQQALKARGYNVFFDYDSLRDGQFNKQIYIAIREAPVFILMLTEGSLDNCYKEDDWVRIEITYALEHHRKIVPVRPSHYIVTFPKNLPVILNSIIDEQISELNKSSLFEESVDKIVKERFPFELHKQSSVSYSCKPITNDISSVFKFYSNENCQILLEGNVIGNIEGMSDKPFCYSVMRKGNYQFTTINSITKEILINEEKIDINEERIIKVNWSNKKTSFQQKLPDKHLVKQTSTQECPPLVSSNNDTNTGSYWCNLLCEHPEFSVHCPWGCLDGSNWSKLLCKQPQFSDHCQWDRFDGLDWIMLLSEQPKFSIFCPWEKIGIEEWSKLLCEQPQLTQYCPKDILKKLFKHT